MDGARHDAAHHDAQKKQKMQEETTYRHTNQIATVAVLLLLNKTGRHCVLRGTYSAEM
jgi:hypothetical protein